MASKSSKNKSSQPKGSHSQGATPAKAGSPRTTAPEPTAPAEGVSGGAQSRPTQAGAAGGSTPSAAANTAGPSPARAQAPSPAPAASPAPNETPFVPPPPLRTPALYGLLLAIVTGLGVSTYLTRAHLELKYGDGSFTAKCDFGSGMNCSDVIGSQYATLFGVLPWSVLAIPAYAAMIMLCLRAFTLKDRKSLGLIALLGTFSVALSAGLFYISQFLIGSLCPFCISLYVVNLLTLILPMVALRGSYADSLRLGFQALQDRRTLALTLANFLLVGSLAFGGYSAVKEALIAQTTDKLKTDGQTANQPPGSSTATNPTQPVAPKSNNPLARKVVPIDASIPFHGPSDAKVTIVAYEDFQCGFCKGLAGNLKQLSERYPKDVRVGFRHFAMNKDCNDANIAKSMHPDACRAAIASECANQQGQFWQYHDLLFKNQRNLSPADLTAYASELNLDSAAFGACQRSPETLAKIKADSVTGGSLGVSGTPTFFMNGRQFAGAQSVEVLSALVDAELKGIELSMAELQNVSKIPDIVGEVKAPEMVKLEGPNGPFEIDSFEATIVDGKAVSKAGLNATTNVSWFDADKACKAAGKRLCTDAEWLTACSGAIPRDENGNQDVTDDRLLGTTYPYGEYYRAGLCNDQVEAPKNASPENPPPLPPLTTGNRPECKSKANVYDMTGNVREWVGFVAPRSAYMGGAFYSRSDAACISRSESAGPFNVHEALGFRCCRGGNPTERITHPGRQTGETLAPFTARALDGSKFDSKSLKGHITLLTFWASWCGPCREEMPAYASIYPELEKRGFRIIAVNVDQDESKARAFLERIPVNYPVLLDTDNSLLSTFDTKAMPTSYLINEKGQILLRKTGFEKGDEKRLVKSVDKLLTQAGL